MLHKRILLIMKELMIINYLIDIVIRKFAHKKSPNSQSQGYLQLSVHLGTLPIHLTRRQLTPPMEGWKPYRQWRAYKCIAYADVLKFFIFLYLMKI